MFSLSFSFVMLFKNNMLHWVGLLLMAEMFLHKLMLKQYQVKLSEITKLKLLFVLCEPENCTISNGKTIKVLLTFTFRSLLFTLLCAVISHFSLKQQRC